VRLRRLEQLQDVLGAGRRPQREQVVVGIGQGPAAADRGEAGITDLRQDHDCLAVGEEGEPVGRAGRAQPTIPLHASP
jgi:hypothetical protein